MSSSDVGNTVEKTGHGAREKAAPEARAPWWKGAVIYQIYPRSFRDSNGDGIGDLKGCIEGLDHIASLGVDAVWLSPFFTSPMKDYGYDIADYCGIDPIFGTMKDFDELVEKAHRLGLKVIIDQVYSHTSDLHDWFMESRSSRTNAKADWYVWADPKADGTPPNNWQSVFGGPAWEWDARRGQYYMHNFLREQPDLNVHNPAVQDALLNVARFWLDRGVDGFRLDALNFSMHDPLMRDNPPSGVPAEKATRPFDMQRKTYNMSHPDTPQWLERIRAAIDEYEDRFTVAEIGGDDPIEEMRAFTAGTKRLNSAYNFDFLYAKSLSPEVVRHSLGQWAGLPGEGWPSWAFSNHDAPRAVTRWAGPEARDGAARTCMMLLMALRGNAFIYQGEELGLPQAHVPFEDLKDPEAIANWPKTLGRDGARTPIPWEAGKANAGFSKAKPWLPVDPEHVPLSIDQQQKQNDSMLGFTRQVVADRSQHPALRQGALNFIESPKGWVAFERTDGAERLICVFNFSDAEGYFRPDGFENAELLRTSWGASSGQVPEMLSPMQGYWARLR